MSNRHIKRPKNEEELYDAIYEIQIAALELKEVIGGHPDIASDDGLSGVVGQHTRDIHDLRDNISNIRAKVNWILGILAGGGAIAGTIVGIINLLKV